MRQNTATRVISLKPLREFWERKLPTRFVELVRGMPPQAILDDVQYQNTLEMIDRIMAAGRLTTGQARYLERLVQLVQAYEAADHAIDTSDIRALSRALMLLPSLAANHPLIDVYLLLKIRSFRRQMADNTER